MRRPWGLFVFLILFLVAAIIGARYLCHNSGDPQQCCATWLTAVGTVFLGVVAIYQDAIRSWLVQPDLRVLYKHSPPFGHRTSWRSSVNPDLEEPVYYFRFQVKNEGQSQARRCEAVLEELWIYDAGENPNKYPNFAPVNLTWVEVGNHSIDISPKRGVYCGIGRVSSSSYQLREERDPRRFVDIPGRSISETDLRFVFEQDRVYFSQPNCVSSGKYAIKVSIYSENAAYREVFFKIAWSGTWQDSEQEMLREIVITPIKRP